MKKIAVISSSVRDGRLSHRVALYMQKFTAEKTGAETDLIDLKEYDFPVFHERLMNMPEPTEKIKDYVRRFNQADGIIIVSPVYNSSFPAALKNVVDLLFSEWKHKPVGIVTVTYGTTPAISTAMQLQGLMMRMGARVASPIYTVLNAGKDFSPEGEPVNPEQASNYAAPVVDELMWLVGKSME